MIVDTNTDVIQIIDTEYTVYEDLHIGKHQTLILKNATVRFASNAGIFSLGTIDAINCSFIPLDENGGWKNIADIGKTQSQFENCYFSGGNGRALGELKDHFISRYFGVMDDMEIIDEWNDATEDDLARFYAIQYGGALITLNSFVHSCTFENCRVNGDGGAIVATSHVEIDACSFKKCYAKGDGGAIHVLEYTTIKKCRFDGCHSRGNGGAIQAETSTRVEESLFIGCYARNGGGMSMESQLSRITNCHFIKCVASSDGGGINGYVHGERLAFIRCRAKRGGGADLEDGSTLSDSLFYQCCAKDEAGGLQSFVIHRVEIEWCKFIQCKAANTGGAAKIRHTTMSQCLFKNNTIHKNNMDGMCADHLYDSGESLIDRCTFEGCRFEETKIPQFVSFE